MCRRCESGSVENVGHVLDECVKWNEERREMWAEVEREDVGVMRVMMGKIRRERVEWLLKGGEKKMRMEIQSIQLTMTLHTSTSVSASTRVH